MFPLTDTQGSRNFPFWVFVIIGFNVWFFLMELTAADPNAFINQYALIPSHIDFTNWETLKPFITSQFVHAGVIHILSNLWFLWIFGDNVEATLGFFFFPIFYLLAGIVGALVQYLIFPGSTIPMVGASGAIAGVLGIYLAFFPRHRIRTLIPIFFLPAIIDIPAWLMLIYWFLTQVFSGTAALTNTAEMLGGIAFFTHIGGFLFGYLIGKLLK